MFTALASDPMRLKNSYGRFKTIYVEEMTENVISIGTQLLMNSLWKVCVVGFSITGGITPAPCPAGE